MESMKIIWKQFRPSITPNLDREQKIDTEELSDYIFPKPVISSKEEFMDLAEGVEGSQLQEMFLGLKDKLNFQIIIYQDINTILSKIFKNQEILDSIPIPTKLLLELKFDGLSKESSTVLDSNKLSKFFYLLFRACHDFMHHHEITNRTNLLKGLGYLPPRIEGYVRTGLSDKVRFIAEIWNDTTYLPQNLKKGEELSPYLGFILYFQLLKLLYQNEIEMLGLKCAIINFLNCSKKNLPDKYVQILHNGIQPDLLMEQYRRLGNITRNNSQIYYNQISFFQKIKSGVLFDKRKHYFHDFWYKKAFRELTISSSLVTVTTFYQKPEAINPRRVCFDNKSIYGIKKIEQPVLIHREIRQQIHECILSSVKYESESQSLIEKVIKCEEMPEYLYFQFLAQLVIILMPTSEIEIKSASYIHYEPNSKILSLSLLFEIVKNPDLDARFLVSLANSQLTTIIYNEAQNDYDLPFKERGKMIFQKNKGTSNLDLSKYSPEELDTLGKKYLHILLQIAYYLANEFGPYEMGEPESIFRISFCKLIYVSGYPYHEELQIQSPLERHIYHWPETAIDEDYSLPWIDCHCSISEEFQTKNMYNVVLQELVILFLKPLSMIPEGTDEYKLTNEYFGEVYVLGLSKILQIYSRYLSSILHVRQRYCAKYK